MRWAWFRVCAALVVCAATAMVAPDIAVAQVDGGSDAEARRRFDEGRAHFDAGEFADAANAFRRAYVLSPRYALLYNIGQAELRAGRDAEALEAFEGFLRQAPADDARRSEVEERVRVLRAMGIAASTGTVVATAEPEPATPEPEADPVVAATPAAGPADGGGSDPTGWIIAGIGGAVAVGGAILLGVGVADAGSVTGAPDGTRWADIEGAAGRANAEFAAGVAMLAVGVAALGVGIALGATSGGGGSGETSASLIIGPGGVSLAGTF